nr:hypothetical protein [Brucella intermedia]
MLKISPARKWIVLKTAPETYHDKNVISYGLHHDSIINGRHDQLYILPSEMQTMIHSTPNKVAPEAGFHAFGNSGMLQELQAKVEDAKRKANSSLRRARSAPGPHVTTNSIFLSLYEEHLRDRESLFSSLRQLDDMRKNASV